MGNSNGESTWKRFSWLIITVLCGVLVSAVGYAFSLESRVTANEVRVMENGKKLDKIDGKIDRILDRLPSERRND